MSDAPSLSRRGLVAGAAALLASPRAVAATPVAKIACIGDSMVDGVWGGLYRLGQRDACLKDRLDFGRYGRNGTGLARADTLDWVAETSKIAAQYRPNLFLASFGLNDQQQIVTPTRERIAYGSAAWLGSYRLRLEKLLAAAAASEAGIVWIGNPAMRDAAMQERTAALNALAEKTIAERADPKAFYLAPWRSQASAADAFHQYDGASRAQLRAVDGVHFTPAGYDRVAEYALPALLARLQAARIALAYPCLRLGRSVDAPPD